MKIKKEIWKKIEFNKDYEVSSCGKVRRLTNYNKRYPRGYILGNREINGGYLITKLSKNGKEYPWLIHRLVFTVFKECIHKNKEINHKDGNKKNNFIDNLEMITPSENTKHAYKNGMSYGMKGEKNGRAKLTKSQVLKIRNDGKKNMQNLKILAEKYDVTTTTIFKILNKRLWKHI